MPTNGESEYLLYGIDGAPIFTYGMIALTTIVIAYSTLVDGDNLPSFVPTPMGILDQNNSSSTGGKNSANSSPNHNAYGGKKSKHKRKTKRNIVASSSSS
jgi:hypothetical protein